MRRPAHLSADELRRLLTGSSAVPWRPLLAGRVHLRLCNRVVAIGTDQAMAELAFLFDNVGAIGSSILEIWPIPSGSVVDTDLMPRLGVSGHPSVPCAVIVHQDKVGRLLDVRFYFDPSSLFGRPH